MAELDTELTTYGRLRPELELKHTGPTRSVDIGFDPACSPPSRTQRKSGTTGQACLSAILLAMVLTPAAAAAQGYVGVGLGVGQLRFEPYYTYYRGGTPDKFDNRTTGLKIDLIGGQRFAVGGPFSLDWRGTFGVNRQEWTLVLVDEPASFEYSLPYTLVVSAVPEVRVSSLVSVFGGIGGGVGRVREIKESPTTSAYDYQAFRGVVMLSGGMRIQSSASTEVFAQYDHLRYSTFEYDTFTPAGDRIEHVRDAPRAHSVSFGVAIRF